MGRKMSRRNKAGFVKVDKTEYLKEISGKLREQLYRQKKYASINLALGSKAAQLKEFNKQIEDKQKYGLPIKIKWHGMEYPLDVLIADFNISLFQYKELLSELKYLEQALKNDGLTDEQISEAGKGIYTKSAEDLDKIDLDIANLDKPGSGNAGTDKDIKRDTEPQHPAV